ncbi:transglutaminase-like domain-containing protein [Psychroserpens sp. SPM9]|uniref:transglutaminase-like domain-containing protein n=1 Tax=Psychroserpens sp. SPM9 TaxID=2975598 RepID=UPI0021A41285|nr:transglutaminase-like domain-containing protein [Psychroserpens sp. SPM9]MDG5492227.1 transglutaminase-like domain-containing protein [Psychroserpens sp. SPM9]
MILKKISWVFKRHPFLYIARFKLLSKNSNIKDIDQYTYNQINQKADIPKYFNEVNTVIFKDVKPQTDLDLIKHLSSWLQNNIKGGPGLSEPSDAALKIMLSGKGGVCSDMAQVFNNFCVINDLKVREWGNTRAPFDKNYGGHSYNEVYCKELNKWILIDVYSCVLFYYNDNPLSVIDLYELIRKNEKVSFKSFNFKKEINEKNIIKNYLNPDTVPFLICNYSNKTYDKVLRKFRPRVPVFIVHFGLFVLGKSYHYRFPLDDYKQILS